MTATKPKPPREIWVVQWTHVNGSITLGAYPSKDRADAWEACIRALHTTDVLARGRYVLADAPSRKPRKRKAGTR